MDNIDDAVNCEGSQPVETYRLYCGQNNFTLFTSQQVKMSPVSLLATLQHAILIQLYDHFYVYITFYNGFICGPSI